MRSIIVYTSIKNAMDSEAEMFKRLLPLSNGQISVIEDIGRRSSDGDRYDMISAHAE